MTKEDFQLLQVQQKESGMGLLQFLQLQSIKYSTFRYWSRKYKEEPAKDPQTLTPISFKKEVLPAIQPQKDKFLPEGITVALPNGIQAHFSSDKTEAAIDFLTRSLQYHVLSE